MIRLDREAGNTRKFHLRKYYPFLVRHLTTPSPCWHEILANRVRYALERLAVEESVEVEGITVRRTAAWRVSRYKVERSEALTLTAAVNRVCELAGGRRDEA